MKSTLYPVWAGERKDLTRWAFITAEPHRGDALFVDTRVMGSSSRRQCRRREVNHRNRVRMSRTSLSRWQSATTETIYTSAPASASLCRSCTTASRLLSVRRVDEHLANVKKESAVVSSYVTIATTETMHRQQRPLGKESFRQKRGRENTSAIVMMKAMIVTPS
jgi:hypothetical protein